MRNYFFLLLLSVCALMGVAQEKAYQINEVSVINYGDGRLLFRQQEKPNTPLTGKHRLIDGVRSEYILAEFKDGMYHGAYQHFKNNKPTEKSTYKEGRLIGVRKQYHSDGQTLRSEATFAEGKLNGTVRNYAQSGKVETEKEYKMGLEDGFDRRYHHETGQLTIDTRYKEGRRDGKWTEHLSRNIGDVVRVSLYENGVRQGEWSETWANGTPRKKSAYKDGKKNGVWVDYRKDGKPEQSTTYANDEQNGLAIRYFTDGKVEKQAHYRDGQQDGLTQEFYYDSGKLKAEYNYKDGKRDGVYKLFTPQGTLREEGRYEDNTDVLRKEYHENGKLKSVAGRPSSGGGWNTTEQYDGNGKKEE